MATDGTYGFVETSYGRVPGCPICGLIPLSRPLLCEHGVTSAPSVEITVSAEVFDRGLYDRLRADQMLYGFSVIGTHGERVDPRTIEPAD